MKKITIDERDAQRAENRRKAEEEPARNRALAQAWDSWIGSEEGERCMTEGAFGEYLRNRLWRAFMAGAASETHSG